MCKMSLLILLVSLVGVFSEDLPENVALSCQYVPADIKYLFYNIQNPVNPIIVPSNNFAAIKNTHYNKAKQTLLLVHGSGGNSSGPLVQKVRNATVNAKVDINVIGVDWRQFQLRNKEINVYNCTKLFGTIVANFVNEMIKNHGMQYNDLTIVGHSIASKFCVAITSYLKSKIKSIVGLESCAVNRNAAQFVECIHTGRANGSPGGHANFYPNGGGHQPDCPPPPDWGCNHWRVIDLYAESLTSNKFVAKQCDTYENYKAGKCAHNTIALMGTLHPNIKANGTKFFLDTNAKPPYAKG